MAVPKVILGVSYDAPSADQKGYELSELEIVDGKYQLTGETVDVRGEVTQIGERTYLFETFTACKVYYIVQVKE